MDISGFGWRTFFKFNFCDICSHCLFTRALYLVVNFHTLLKFQPQFFQSFLNRIPANLFITRAVDFDFDLAAKFNRSWRKPRIHKSIPLKHDPFVLRCQTDNIFSAGWIKTKMRKWNIKLSIVNIFYVHWLTNRKWFWYEGQQWLYDLTNA